MASTLSTLLKYRQLHKHIAKHAYASHIITAETSYMLTPRLTFSTDAIPQRLVNSDDNTMTKRATAPPADVREPQLSAKQFNAEVLLFFDKLDAALKDMTEVNNGFTLERDNDQLTYTVNVGESTGSYQFNVSPASKRQTPRLLMFSPISGAVYQYQYSIDRDSWVGVDDGHFIEEIITRELLRNCQGVPNF